MLAHYLLLLLLTPALLRATNEERKNQGEKKATEGKIIKLYLHLMTWL